MTTYLAPFTVAGAKMGQQVSQTAENWSGQNPGRHLTAAAGHQRQAQKLGATTPASRRQHTSDARPPETRADNDATAHLAGDRRLKRDGSSTESRLQFQADAIPPGHDARLQPQGMNRSSIPRQESIQVGTPPGFARRSDVGRWIHDDGSAAILAMQQGQGERRRT
jgi:hypothetical protein